MWWMGHFIKLKSYQILNAPYAYAQARKCNCIEIMHAHYFCVFWVSSIQIGCSMRIVYAECKNEQDSHSPVAAA